MDGGGGGGGGEFGITIYVLMEYQQKLFHNYPSEPYLLWNAEFI